MTAEAEGVDCSDSVVTAAVDDVDVDDVPDDLPLFPPRFFFFSALSLRTSFDLAFFQLQSASQCPSASQKLQRVDELDEDEVRVETSCVDESELDVVVELLLGVDSTDWRSAGMGRGRAVRGGDSFGFTEPRSVADEARRQGVQGIACGHIHHPEIREIDGIVYCNDGDWVESCTALVEHHDGRLELLRWLDVKAGAGLSRLAA